MAARENQGYLIAIIILVLLSLVLAITAFLGLSKMGEYADGKTTAETSLKGEQKLSQAYSIQAEIMKAYIGDFGNSAAEVPVQLEQLKGLSGGSGIDANKKTLIEGVYKDTMAIDAVYQKDKLSNTASAEDDAFTWRAHIQNLTTVLSKKHGEYNVKVQQALLAKQEADAKIQTAKTLVEQMEGKVQTLETDLAKEKQLSADKQKELKMSLEQSEVQLRDVNTKYADFKTSTEGTIETLKSDLTNAGEVREQLKIKINNYEREVFDRPDGQIVSVASSLDTVFLDLGATDGLTPNRTFVVYDQSVTNFEKDQHKAMIEITRVSANQSEGRVTEEDPTNPILSGDYVLTATWDPGQSIPMALAGFFDLDNDGFSDQDKLVQMIKRNGGTVVCWHNDKGEIQGKLDSTVRYLVLGSAPNTGPDANPLVVKAMDRLEKMADEATVQTIDLQKLLTRMGVRAKPRVEKIDRRFGDFEKRSPSDTLKSSDK